MGRMGRRHLQVALDKRLEIVGICDAVAEAVRVGGEEHGVPEGRRYTDAERMLREQRPQCVVVATHATSHCDYVLQAAAAGASHIFCEKPLAVSLTDCDRMIEACRRAGAALAVNHQMRFMPQYVEPKRLLDSEAYGGLASVTVVTGNFGLAMNGTHYFEMFRYLAGEAPIEATAWFSDSVLPNPRGPQFQDRAGSVRLTARSGKRFYLECGDDQGHGLNVVYAARNGTIHVDELTGTLRTAVRKAEHRALPTTRYGMPWDDSTMQIPPADSTAPTRAVLDAFLDGGSYPTAEDGRLAVAALVACYVSHESGHAPIRIDDRLPRDRAFPWA